MKVFVWISLLLILSACNRPSEAIEVTIKHHPFLDSMCSLFKSYNIEEAWKLELASKKVELEREWQEYGGQLLLTTEKIVGENINREKITAHLTLCNSPSRSFPIIVNMRYSLSSFTDSPVSIHDKVGTLHHEILHQYIDDNLSNTTPILKLFKDEHLRVLRHIHLLALQKAVYLDLQLDTKLSSIIKTEGKLPNGYYKRAWEIVNTSENYYLELVNELKTP